MSYFQDLVDDANRCAYAAAEITDKVRVRTASLLAEHEQQLALARAELRAAYERQGKLQRALELVMNNPTNWVIVLGIPGADKIDELLTSDLNQRGLIDAIIELRKLLPFGLAMAKQLCEMRREQIRAR